MDAAAREMGGYRPQGFSAKAARPQPHRASRACSSGIIGLDRGRKQKCENKNSNLAHSTLAQLSPFRIPQQKDYAHHAHVPGRTCSTAPADTLDFVEILNGKNCRASVTYAWSLENDHTKGIAGRNDH
jgi:hypothetical protein